MVLHFGWGSFRVRFFEILYTLVLGVCSWKITTELGFGLFAALDRPKSGPRVPLWVRSRRLLLRYSTVSIEISQYHRLDMALRVAYLEPLAASLALRHTNLHAGLSRNRLIHSQVLEGTSYLGFTPKPHLPLNHIHATMLER